jgi:hypothetical protein
LGVRKWNRDLSLADNLRSNSHQPVVRLAFYSVAAWSLLWVLAASLAAIDFDRQTALANFLAWPCFTVLIAAFVTYAALPLTALGRGLGRLEARSAAGGGALHWGLTIVYFVAWLPFVGSNDAGWVAATSWIATPAAALAGLQAGVGLLALAGRLG